MVQVSSQFYNRIEPPSKHFKITFKIFPKSVSIQCLIKTVNIVTSRAGQSLRAGQLLLR